MHKKQNSKALITQAFLYTLLTIGLGLIIILLSLNKFEVAIVLDLQSFLRGTIGIQLFYLITYIGDFYIWTALTIIYLIYSFIKLKKKKSQALELAIFFVLTTIITYFFKDITNRPRPYQYSSDVMQYTVEDYSSYPSGHVSRAFGALLILSNKSKAARYLSYVGVFLLALSRIIVGAHYPTDTIGAIFLSLAALKISDYVMYFLENRGLISKYL